jgi:predicted Rossmann fold nucleotide-binding protein DprA/Smf involved in DNA uptake
MQQKLNLTGKKLAVVGSRTFDDKQKLYEVLTKNRERIKLIVSGGAQGADTLATQWAADYGMPYLVFPALWRDPETLVFDKGAGFRRNRYIVEHSDVIMAFWDGKSNGTAHTIDMAKQAGKPVHIIYFTPVVKTENAPPLKEGSFTL